jgi:hypothetical protein
MISAIMTIVVAMLVYIFWFIRMEVARLYARIDESAIGIARMNKEMIGSIMKVLTQPMLPELEEGSDDDQEGGEVVEEEEEEDIDDIDEFGEDADQAAAHSEDATMDQTPSSAVEEVEVVDGKKLNPAESTVTVSEPTTRRSKKKGGEKNTTEVLV